MRIVGVNRQVYIEPRIVYGIGGPIGVAGPIGCSPDGVEVELTVRGTPDEVVALINMSHRAEPIALERGKWVVHDRPHLRADEFEVAADLCEKHGLDSVAAALRNLAKGKPF